MESKDLYINLTRFLVDNGLESCNIEELDPVYYSKLCALAIAEGVGPLLFKRMQELDLLASIPVVSLNDLVVEYYNSLAINHLLFRELSKILQRFYERDIPVVVLKGAILATDIYLEPALRPMSDIDLLVSPQLLNIALDTLISLGFEIQKVSYHVMLLGGGNQNLRVDLHWCVVGNGNQKRVESWFWDHAESFHFITNEVDLVGLRLTPTANFLYLFIHLVYQHGLDKARMLWYYDIHILLEKRGDDIAWEQIQRICSDSGYTGGLLNLISNLKTYFLTPFPSSLIGELESSKYLYENVIYEDQKAKNQILTSFTHLGFTARLRLLRFFLFPSYNYLKQKYHPEYSWLLPLYYPYRWLQLIFQ